MRRNGIVSVFLRVLEYYSGILILTTNKIGHFDEAFKSRIHISLYYPPLNKRSTLKIWKMNLERLAKSERTLEVNSEEIYEFARKHYRELHKSGKTTWNGRQIKNAFQTAIALAEFNANKKQEKPVLDLAQFKVVAQVSEKFEDYIDGVHGGNEADLAQRNMQRYDDPMGGRRESWSYNIGGLKSRRGESSTSSTSSEDSEAEEKKKPRKEKRKRKKSSKSRRRAKAQALESEESSSSKSE